MARNKQLTFPFDDKSYLSPYEDEYIDKLESLHFGDRHERPRDVENKLRETADTISNVFSWEDTVEGMDFWAHACDALYAMSDEMERRNKDDDDSVLVTNWRVDGGCMADFDIPQPRLDELAEDDDNFDIIRVRQDDT